MILDDMVFKEYPTGGYQCLIETKAGWISVRYGSNLLFTESDKPYEVWYPTEDEPTGYQTANDIFTYIDALNVQRP